MRRCPVRFPRDAAPPAARARRGGAAVVALAALALGGCAHASQEAASCAQAARQPGIPAALRAQIRRDARADPNCRVPTAELNGAY